MDNINIIGEIAYTERGDSVYAELIKSGSKDWDLKIEFRDMAGLSCCMNMPMITIEDLRLMATQLNGLADEYEMRFSDKNEK